MNSTCFSKQRKFSGKHLLVWRVSLAVFLAVLQPMGSEFSAHGFDGAVSFPETRPENGNFNRPASMAELDISPPGFCWWRAGQRNKVFYRLHIRNQRGETVYQSPRLDDPVHVPDVVLAAGRYSWSVDALTGEGRVADSLGPRTFTIAANAASLPWVPAEELLRRVRIEHPRLLFPKHKLPQIRNTLETSRREAFNELRQIADEAVRLELMQKPDFDKFDRETEYAARRVAYRQDYHEFTRVYIRGMLPMALAYVLTGETEYAVAAKAHLLNLLDWDVDGIASLESGFDEIGLRICRVGAQAYDWLYDALTPRERSAVKQMLVTHGNQMLERLQKRDFLNYSEYSHDGRLPGYLVEFSIALAEEPAAQVWMDYAMRALLTVFPHWAGRDGGWAEGVSYAFSYNERFITPIQSLYEGTDLDLWKKPFFRKFRYFPLYTISPRAEILPFGDGEDRDVTAVTDRLVSVLQFHAMRYQDPAVRWWIDQFDQTSADSQRLGVVHRLILPDTLSPKLPAKLPNDRSFFGIGWAALHSDLSRPDQDLMVLFKSSPYGAVSHSHADQNSFAIMKGGKALAIPGGARYPQHGSPFHEQYTQLTVAHNTLLVDGHGQINRDGNAHGRLAEFKSLPHLGYVCGDARKCYGDRLQRFNRHVVLIRPSLILVIDDLEASEPVQIQWLMHAKERLEMDESVQGFISRRGQIEMHVHLFCQTPLDFQQSDQWPFDPRKGYPMVTAPRPHKQWHFAARSSTRRKTWRIAAVMAVGEGRTEVDYKTRTSNDGDVFVEASFGEAHATARINLAPAAATRRPLARVRYEPSGGEAEELIIPTQ